MPLLPRSNSSRPPVGTRVPSSPAPLKHKADHTLPDGSVVTVCELVVKARLTNNDPSCPDCMYILRDESRMDYKHR
jgi:hypothetical protein